MKELTYKRAELWNYDDFYKVKCDPENVKWSGFTTAPDYNRMCEWYKAQMVSDKRTIYLCYWNGDVCGFFYLDKISAREFEAFSPGGGMHSREIGSQVVETHMEMLSFAEEVGYGVMAEFSGRGIGTDIVRRASEMASSMVICAWVSEENRASQRCFEKNGFVQHDICAERSLAAFSKPHKFYFWSKLTR